MTADAKSTTRTLQEDLLAGMRDAAPVAAAGRAQGPRPAPRRPATDAEPVPAVELQVTPTRWASPSVRSVPGRSGVLLCAGPIRLSLSLPGR
jgi:hypothetical protein